MCLLLKRYMYKYTFYQIEMLLNFFSTVFFLFTLHWSQILFYRNWNVELDIPICFCFYEVQKIQIWCQLFWVQSRQKAHIFFNPKSATILIPQTIFIAFLSMIFFRSQIVRVFFERIFLKKVTFIQIRNLRKNWSAKWNFRRHMTFQKRHFGAKAPELASLIIIIRIERFHEFFWT